MAHTIWSPCLSNLPVRVMLIASPTVAHTGEILATDCGLVVTCNQHPHHHLEFNQTARSRGAGAGDTMIRQMRGDGERWLGGWWC